MLLCVCILSMKRHPWLGDESSMGSELEHSEEALPKCPTEAQRPFSIDLAPHQLTPASQLICFLVLQTPCNVNFPQTHLCSIILHIYPCAYMQMFMIYRYRYRLVKWVQS